MEKILELLMENPEAIIDTVKEGINKYKPLAYELLHELLKIYEDYANNKEYPATVAKAKKNMFDAYVTVGFTEDQAIALMLNDNLKLEKNIKEFERRSSNSTRK